MPGTVRIVHAVDTEGPLYEPLRATFERLEEVFGLHLEPSQHNLKLLRQGKLVPAERKETIMQAVSEERLNTLGSWDQIDEMLDEITSDRFRAEFLDSDGEGWVYNWFCLDHVGFESNPRRRDMGYHNIYDRYLALVQSQPFARDAIEWHFHPISTYREAHRCATHYLRSDEIYQVLARRILERGFFPSSFRAGFQAERPDIHWFLEQFIPFDLSNMATKDFLDLDNSIDFRNGRSGDWRKAPSDWSVYHPSHDDHRVPGTCRRLIGRALNLQNRIGKVTSSEMDRAFERAQGGKDVLVGLASHDWRHMLSDVHFARDLISKSMANFPDVAVKFCRSDEAFRAHVDRGQSNDAALDIELTLYPESADDVSYLKVKVLSGKVFGPQPFLAIQTRGNRFVHDNLDWGEREGEWFYAFHADTLPLQDVSSVGVGANDAMGRSVVRTIKME